MGEEREGGGTLSPPLPVPGGDYRGVTIQKICPGRRISDELHPTRRYLLRRSADDGKRLGLSESTLDVAFPQVL